MRLIDADALSKSVLEWLPSDPCGRPEAEHPFETDICVSMLMEIEDAPIIDAVPVVRCKDCRYAKLFEDRDGLCGHPSNNAWDIFDEFYCGRGVKHEP